MKLKELFAQVAYVYQQYGILVCYFSFKDKDEFKNDIISFRIYYTTEDKSYIHNPLPYIKHKTLESALEWILKEIENKYI